MRFDTDEKALGLQIFDDGFTSFITIHAAVFFGHVIVKMCRFGHDVDLLQVMALTDFKVIEVVSRRNLHAAGTELFIHIIVSDDGDFSVCQRKLQFLSDQIFIAFVFRINSNSLVAEHSFRTSRCNDDAFGAVSSRITNFPKMSVLFFRFDFQVGNRSLKFRVPVNETAPSVNQAFFIEVYEAVDHNFSEVVVHCEIETVPVKGVA